MSEIEIPAQELLSIDSLKTDNCNPNFMSKSKLGALEQGIRRWGFLVPIITNKDLLVADGEQRLKIAKKLHMTQVPVIRLPVCEVDRKLLRQVLNKLKGEHIEHLDAEEFKFIIKESEKARQDLGLFLQMRDSQIEKLLKKDQQQTSAAANKKKKKEDPHTFVKCPKCQHVFDPVQHKAISFLSKVELPKLEFQDIPADALNKDFNVLLNVAFETKQPDVTERVVAVAHSFGLGIDETRTFPIFNNFIFQFSKGDIVYCTGDSGSGKTVFLKELRSYCLEKGLTVASISEVDPQPKERIIESLGVDVNQAMSLLSAVGLSEAFIMLAEYENLSDGQRYRYRLAKLFARRTDVIFIDEFCATLDREMAKVISYNLQRFLRKTGQTAFIASTHQDLINDLDPDILLFKRFGDQAQLDYADPAREPKEFSLLKELKIEECQVKDVEELLKFHYLSHNLAVVNHVYKMTLRGELVGCIVYTNVQTLDLSLREKFFPEYKDTDTTEGAQRLNREVLRISRVVLNPKYRGVGLAIKLVKETLPLPGAKLVETIAAMAKYNPFFEKAGMRVLGVLGRNKNQDLLRAKITEYGGNPELLYSKREAKKFWATLSEQQRLDLSELVFKVATQRFSIGTNYGEGKLSEMMKIASNEGAAAMIKQVMLTEKLMLVWENPDWKENTTEKSDLGG